MEVSKDIGKVLLHLDNFYYEKGMSKITTPVKGVRQERIALLPRKIVISQLLYSKKSGIQFIREFLENMKGEFALLEKDENIKNIVDNPNESNQIAEKCNKELLYLYLFSLEDEKYNCIMESLLQIICNSSNKEYSEKDGTKELQCEITKYKKTCEQYAVETTKLREILKQRKNKIKELEIRNKCLNDDKIELEKKNILLEKKIDLLVRQSESKKIEESVEEKRKDFNVKCDIVAKKIAVIRNEAMDFIGRNNVIQMTANEFIAADDTKQNDYVEVLVYKQGIHISKLRKIKRLSSSKVHFFDTKNEIVDYLNMEEEKNENRSN